MFIDEITIHAKAGKGGNGVVAWRREKFKPKAGPGGGNGGNGGDFFAEAVADIQYLRQYQHDKDFSAENGQIGGNFGKKGANGADLILKFPVGSLITHVPSGRSIFLESVDQRVLLLSGGKGGYGNEHFKSSVNRSPQDATPGRPGEEADFAIELKLIADIGLVGLPSAGKSTLLNSLTNAQSKVGAYLFTTLEPHLGVLISGAVMADIPGLIEGASGGRGLGHKFLRHIERTAMIAHVVAVDRDDLVHDYQIIRKELAAYDENLTKKKELIIVSKIDMLENEFVLEKIVQDLKKASGHSHIIGVSAFDEESLNELHSEISRALARNASSR